MINLIIGFALGEVFTIVLLCMGRNRYLVRKGNINTIDFHWGSYDPNYPEYVYPLKSKELVETDNPEDFPGMKTIKVRRG